MSDPRSVVPYHDPHDSPITFDFYDLMIDANPTLENLSSINEQQQQQSTSIIHHHQHLSSNDIVDPNDPFDDPIIWNVLNSNSNNDNDNDNDGGIDSVRQSHQEPGPSTQNNYCNVGDEDNVNDNVRSSTCFDDGTPLTIWPPSLAPFQCTYCQVLREIIHTDGKRTSKLEIHGRLGMICHAVLENKDSVVEGSSRTTRFHMIDFCKKSIENVKQYLRQYCENRKKAGYVLVQDPLSVFYEALCVGIQWDEYMNNDDFCDPSSSTFSGLRQRDKMERGNEAERVTKTALAQQRERTGKLTLKDFRAYFDVPIEEAARRMNLCPTVVKKICRRDGMNRWPYRKIKSIQRQISNLRPAANSNDAEERARALADIRRLQQEISNICAIATS